MLITSLLPLLTHYSLSFDLVAGPDETVTLTILPRKVAGACLLYTSPSPRDRQKSRMPSSA